MKKILEKVYLIGISMFLFYACVKDLPKLEFFSILTNKEVANISTTTAEVKGYIKNIKDGTIIEIGHCYSDTLTIPILANSLKKQVDELVIDTFTNILTNLNPQSIYYYRSFAILSDETKRDTFYGEVAIFNTSLISIATDTRIVSQQEDKLLFGSINGIDDKVEIKDYGHCWNFNNELPSIDNINHSKTSLNALTQDLVFSSQLTDLVIGEQYIARAYVLTESGVIYGDTISFIHTVTWRKKKRIPTPPRYFSTFFSLSGKGYIGLGLGADDYFYEYDPENDSWEKIEEPFPGGRRHHALSFVIGDTAYIGTGTIINLNGNELGGATGSKTKDIWKFCPSKKQNMWEYETDFPLGNTTNSAAFSHNGIGYILRSEYNNRRKQFDLLAYDPQKENNKWSGKLPYDETSTVTLNAFAAFKLDNYFYFCPSLPIDNDFRRYDIIKNKWEKTIKPFDGLWRSDFAAFTVKDKGWIGLGRTSTIQTGYADALDDIWEYNPANDKWEKNYAFEGGPSSYPISITIGNKVYVLTIEDSTLWEFNPN